MLDKNKVSAWHYLLCSCVGSNGLRFKLLACLFVPAEDHKQTNHDRKHDGGDACQTERISRYKASTAAAVISGGCPVSTVVAVVARADDGCVCLIGDGIHARILRAMVCSDVHRW